MEKQYQPASLSPRAERELKRLETQLARDTGRAVILVAYEPDAAPAPGFSDIQKNGPASCKQNTFQGENNLYGNITQWHI